jgi:hypothetical protein
VSAFANPNLAFLASLQDRSKYKRAENVPIFGPHKRRIKGPDGEEKEIEVTAADLPGIVADMKRRERLGMVLIGTEGHRRPTTAVAEKDQPEVISYFAEPRVGTFKDAAGKDRVGILATNFIPVNKLGRVGQYPYVSADFYPFGIEIRPGQRTITGVAHIKRDSYLELGTLDLAAVAYHGKFPCVPYAMEASNMAEEKKENEAEREATAHDEPGELPEEHKRLAEQYMAHYKAHHPFMGYAAKCYEASLAAAGAENAGTPEKVEKPGTVAQNAAITDPVAYEQKLVDQQKKLADQQKQIDQLRREKEQAACEQMVGKLVAEGYEMDAAYEASILLPLDGMGRAKRAKYIREHYRQTDGGYVAVYEGHVEGEGPNVNDPHKPPAYHKRAEQYMRAHPGMSYEAAVDHVTSIKN